MFRFRFVFAFAATAFAAFAQQYTINTFAGTGGSAGYAGDGGPASSAQFNNPFAIARDAKGNFYISDLGNYVIRKIDTDGNVSTFAGSNSFGFSGDGGPATSAQISNVNGIATDAKGNVYLADTLNARVRIVTPDGNIATFAGNGTYGYAGDGGPAVNSVLYYPSGVATDSQGNVYIADYGDAVIRKVDTNGIIATFAGTGSNIFGAVLGNGGQATQAALSIPFSVATDGGGNLYIGDLGTGSIRRVATNGIISTVASSVAAVNFAIDNAGAFYYSDYTTSTVVKRYANGTSFWIAGNGQPGYSGDGGPGTSAQLNAPYGIALDPSGNVYVADSKNEVIRELTPASFSISSVANAASNIGFVNVGSGNSGSSAASVAPGEIVTLFGSGLGPDSLVQNTPQNGQFGTNLAGVSVSFNGVFAPIIYTSAAQTAVVVPYEIDGLTSVYVAIGYNGQITATTVPVAPTAPGIFTLNSTGSGQAAAVNANGTINGSANPVHPGDYISLYVTGEGTTSPAGSNGQISGANPPAPNASVSVTIGGQSANVTYAAEAPFEISGLMQINVQVPPGLSANGAAPVVVNVGGVNSQNGVTIAVSQ